MKLQAIIIKKIPTGEYDQIVVCYTRELGKLAAVAKSSLKPNSSQGPQLDLFNLVEFELVEGRSMPIITGAQCEKSYYGIKSRLPSLAIAHFFLEAIDKIVFDHQPDEKLWSFMAGTLEELDQKQITLTHFRDKQKNLLYILGYGANGQLASYDNAPIDLVFENLAARRFKSLRFLYSLIS